MTNSTATQEIEKEILHHIQSQYGVEDVDTTTPLFSSQRLDSLSMITLITYLEKQFAIKISPLEVSVETLNSAQQMAQFVYNKLSSSSK